MALLRAAVALLSPRPRVRRIPGWHFGMGEEAHTIGLRLRKVVWHRGRRLGHLRVRLRWLEGLIAESHLGSDLSRCVFVGGAYEPNEFALLASVVQPGMTFIDVGANEGLFSTFVARRTGPTGRVFAIEPSSREFGMLERNLMLNRLDNVAAIRAAACNRNGEGLLRIAEPDHAGQSTLGDFAYEIKAVESQTVPLARLDDLLQEAGAGRIDVMKIDVEGAEVSALQGAARILQRDRPLLLVEVVDAALRGHGASREALTGLLQEFGYGLFVFGSDGRPRAIEKLTLDGINVVAEHKDRSFGLPTVG